MAGVAKEDGVHTRSGGVEINLWSVPISPPDCGAGLVVNVVGV